MQIMLLTDGDVSNTREVIDLVRKNAINTRYVWNIWNVEILDFIFFNYVYIHTHTYQCRIVTVTAVWQMMMMMKKKSNLCLQYCS